MDLPSEVLNIKGLCEGLARSQTLHAEDLEEVGIRLLIQSLQVQSPGPSSRSSPISSGLIEPFDYRSRVDTRFGLTNRLVRPKNYAQDARHGVLAALKVLGRDILPVADQANAVIEVLKDAEVMTYTETKFGSDLTEYCVPFRFHFQATQSELIAALEPYLLSLSDSLTLRLSESVLRWKATNWVGSELLSLAASMYWRQGEVGNQEKVSQLLVALSCVRESTRGITRQDTDRFRSLGPLLIKVFEKHEIERTRPRRDEELFVDSSGQIVMPALDFGGPA